MARCSRAKFCQTSATGDGDGEVQGLFSTTRGFLGISNIAGSEWHRCQCQPARADPTQESTWSYGKSACQKTHANSGAKPRSALDDDCGTCFCRACFQHPLHDYALNVAATSLLRAVPHQF